MLSLPAVAVYLLPSLLTNFLNLFFFKERAWERPAGA